MPWKTSAEGTGGPPTSRAATDARALGVVMRVALLLHDAGSARVQAAAHRLARRVWRGRLTAGERYGRAAALAAGALLLSRLALHPLGAAHFVFLLGAVALAAAAAGVGPGLLALTVAAAGYPLLAASDPAASGAGLELGQHLTRLGLFLVVGAAEALVAGTLWRERADAVRALQRARHRAERQRRLRRRLRARLAGLRAAEVDHARLVRDTQRALQARDEVLAVVSRDLREPLGAVQLSAALVARLAARHPSPYLGSAARTLLSAANRAARLADDVVDASRLERGNVVLDRASWDAAELAREALAELEPLARRRGVSVSLEAAPGTGDAACDRHRVLQVLSNLLGNALRVTPPGGAIRVRVARRGAQVVFTVADAGPGISTADQPYVFERHWRGAQARYPGTGLGLAIARAVVAAHGGRIDVHSAPGGPHDRVARPRGAL
jgi:signal transduction histidine kinase